MLAYHIRQGLYGDVHLDGLNLIALGAFEGNLWAGETKATLGLFIDERADEGSARRCSRSSVVRRRLAGPIRGRRRRDARGRVRAHYV